MNQMRAGITLFITLSIIATMLALLGIVFKYLETARASAEVKASMIQSNLLSSDMVNILESIIGKKPSSSTMLLLYTVPLAVRHTKGEFATNISCKPIANRANIAWLAMDGKRGYQEHYSLAQRIFDTLVSRANLREPDMLLASINAALTQRESTIFGTQSRLYKKKGIITFSEFRQLLSNYRYKADDSRISQIVWQNYFSFGRDYGKLDSEFVSAELLGLLYEIDMAVVREDYTWGSLDTFLRTIGESRERYKQLWSKDPILASRCSVQYSFREGSYRFSLDYVDKKVENFEFIGQ